MMRTFGTTLMTLALFAPGTLAADPLHDLLGAWRSDSLAFGLPAESTMQWTPVLDGRFVRLQHRIEMRAEDGSSSVFKGVAHYRDNGEDGAHAYWADSSGDLHPIRVAREKSALVAHWGVAGAKQGRTRYELLDADRVRVTDWLLTDDGWRQFNQAEFSRAAADEG